MEKQNENIEIDNLYENLLKYKGDDMPNLSADLRNKLVFGNNQISVVGNLPQSRIIKNIIYVSGMAASILLCVYLSGNLFDLKQSKNQIELYKSELVYNIFINEKN